MKTSLPTLAVFGGGNSIEAGPSYDNVHNAHLAAMLLNQGRANPNLVIALGRGPEDTEYPVTEAQFISEQISEKLSGPTPEFELDEVSISTATNILSLAQILDDRIEIERVGLVCLPSQDNRVRAMAHMALGDRCEIDVFASDAPRSKAGVAKELVLLGIFKASTTGLEPGVRSDYITAVTRYNAVVSRGKSSAIAAANQGFIPGIKGTGRYGKKQA